MKNKSIPVLSLLVFLYAILSMLTGCHHDDDTVIFFPETCADVQERVIDETGDRPTNGTYTLYVYGDETKPWAAYCHDMNRSEPKEYLTVTEAVNYSQIGDGSNLAETKYRRYRIDPIRMTIDPLDDTFATSNFDVFDPVLPSVLASIPAGWAEMQPVAVNSSSAEANVSLAGTPFVFDDAILANSLNDFFCKLKDGLSLDSETEQSLVEVQTDLSGFRLVAVHANSQAYSSGAYAREIADCANLSDTENLTEGAWPINYVGM